MNKNEDGKQEWESGGWREWEICRIFIYCTLNLFFEILLYYLYQ
jgi:hypothetical protein